MGGGHKHSTQHNPAKMCLKEPLFTVDEEWQKMRQIVPGESTSPGCVQGWQPNWSCGYGSGIHMGGHMQTHAHM